jgi:hypothetical protein
VSTERSASSLPLRHDDTGGKEVSGVERSLPMLDAPDTIQIARTLAEKYGWDALPFARERAARAAEIGDELALAAWDKVIEATTRLLQEIANV